MGSTRRREDEAGPKRALVIGVAVFFAATVVYYFSEEAISRLHVALALPLVLLIIGVGVVMDMLGTAVAAAEEPPFHAMAAKRQAAARHAIWLVRRAPVVATFSNDIVGDIAGTISGAAAATISFQTAHWLAEQYMSQQGSAPVWLSDLTGVVAVGLVAALTVGGKALGKSFAINRPQKVVFQAARVLAWVEGATGWDLLGGSGSRGERSGRSVRNGRGTERGERGAQSDRSGGNGRGGEPRGERGGRSSPSSNGRSGGTRSSGSGRGSQNGGRKGSRNGRRSGRGRRPEPAGSGKGRKNT